MEEVCNVSNAWQKDPYDNHWIGGRVTHCLGGIESTSPKSRYFFWVVIKAFVCYKFCVCVTVYCFCAKVNFGGKLISRRKKISIHLPTWTFVHCVELVAAKGWNHPLNQVLVSLKRWQLLEYNTASTTVSCSQEKFYRIVTSQWTWYSSLFRSV